MPYHFTRQQLILHNAWRKALRDGEVTFTLPNPQAVSRLRFALYNCLKPIRAGKAIDDELRQAGEDCCIRTTDTTLIICHKFDSEEMLAVLEVLDTEAQELKQVRTKEEAAIGESVGAVLGKLGLTEPLPTEYLPQSPVPVLNNTAQDWESRYTSGNVTPPEQPTLPSNPYYTRER